MIPYWYLSNVICGGWHGENVGSCLGDSGGPLAKFVESPYPHFIQLRIGIFSRHY
jgi:hypothetical protein